MFRDERLKPALKGARSADCRDIADDGSPRRLPIADDGSPKRLPIADDGSPKPAYTALSGARSADCRIRQCYNDTDITQCLNDKLYNVKVRAYNNVI